MLPDNGVFAVSEGDQWPYEMSGLDHEWQAGGNLIWSTGDGVSEKSANSFDAVIKAVDAGLRMEIYVDGPYFALVLRGGGSALVSSHVWDEGTDMPPGIATPLVVDSDRLAWRLVLISHGTVMRLRSFTTDPNSTRVLLSIRDEWKARGPVPVAEASAIRAYRSERWIAGLSPLCSTRMRPDPRDFNAWNLATGLAKTATPLD